MKWTTEPPTQSGYYWVKWVPDNEKDIVYVTILRNKPFISRIGWDDNPPLESLSGWCGPILEPDNE